MRGSRRCSARFARARDRMTDGPARRRLCRARRGLDLFPVRRPRSFGNSLPTTRRSPQRAVARGGRGGGPLSAFAEERAAAAPGAAVLRQEGRDDRRRNCRNGAGAGAVRMSPAEEAAALLREFGIGGQGTLASRSPIDGSEIGRVAEGDPAAACAAAAAAFVAWRSVPAPRRGELVRLLGEELRAAKEPLARLVTLEAGKIVQRKPRRSAGDDRHLRLRGRPVAPALRPDHRQRAARPPDDRAMASAWGRCW